MQVNLSKLLIYCKLIRFFLLFCCLKILFYFFISKLLIIVRCSVSLFRLLLSRKACFLILGIGWLMTRLVSLFSCVRFWELFSSLYVLLQVHWSSVHQVQNWGGEVYWVQSITHRVQRGVKRGGQLLPGDAPDAVFHWRRLSPTHRLYQRMTDFQSPIHCVVGLSISTLFNFPDVIISLRLC